MKIKKVKIAIFASSPSLLGRIQALSAHRQLQIHFDTHGLDDAIPVAVEMERAGIEVAVGRRGTAHLLRENLRIPVLSFPAPLHWTSSSASRPPRRRAAGFFSRCSGRR